MIIQDALISRIEQYIEKLKKERELDRIEFRVSKSQSTSSTYITLISFVEGERIKLQFRISDHYNSKVKTKILKKNTKFTLIEKEIKMLIRRTNKIRFKIKMNHVSKNQKD